MSRRQQLGLILLATTAVTSLASHLTTRILGIGTLPWIRERLGVQNGSKPICAAGSSLTFYGLDWNKIATATDRPIEKCGVPGGSPCELEPICNQNDSITGPNVTVFGVSTYDLNEHFLSDFRSEIVPLKVAVRDLRASDAGWSFPIVF